jgi:hypothetical protein
MSVDIHLETKQTHTYKINDSITLRIIKQIPKIYVLHFTDECGNIIPIPKYILVYECDGVSNICKIALNRTNDYTFHLFCDNNYKIEYDNKVIIDVKSPALLATEKTALANLEIG